MKTIYIILIIFLFGCTVDYSKVQEKRLQNYLSKNPHADSYTVSKISRGMIDIGMDREEVIASWGEPAEKIKSGIFEKWTYGETQKGYIKVKSIVFLKDGKVINWIK